MFTDLYHEESWALSFVFMHLLVINLLVDADDGFKDIHAGLFTKPLLEAPYVPMMHLICLNRLKLQAPQLPQSARRNDAG